MGHVGHEAFPVLLVGIDKVRHPPHGHGKIGQLSSVRHIRLEGKIPVRIAFCGLGDLLHRFQHMPGIEVKDDGCKNRHCHQTDHQHEEQLLGKAGQLLRRIHQRQICSMLLIRIIQLEMLNIAHAKLLGQTRELIDLEGGLALHGVHQRVTEPDRAVRIIRAQ